MIIFQFFYKLTNTTSPLTDFGFAGNNNFLIPAQMMAGIKRNKKTVISTANLYGFTGINMMVSRLSQN